MMEIDDLSLVQYARFTGVALDHRHEPLPLDDQEIAQLKLEQDVFTDQHLPQIEVPTSFRLDERLELDKGAATLLSALYRQVPPIEHNEMIDSLLDVRRTRSLLIEGPLLRTDAEADQRAFARVQPLDLSNHGCPRDFLDTERDQSLSWPSWVRSAGDILDEVQKERLPILRVDMLYLQTSLRNEWTDDDEREIWDMSTSYKKITALEPLTPPLLPSQPDLTTSLPSSSLMQIPLLSDPVSETSSDIRREEAYLFVDDVLLPPSCVASSSISDNINPDTLPINTYWSPTTFLQTQKPPDTVSWHKLKDLKVEVPLSPRLQSPEHRRPFVFPTDISTLVAQARHSCDKEDGLTRDVLETNDVAFTKALQDMADEAERRVSQEQLLAADTNHRVKVPLMYFKDPTPAYDEFRKLCRRSDFATARRVMFENVGNTYGLPQVEVISRKWKDTLRWNPFPPDFGKYEVEESLDHEDCLKQYLGSSDSRAVIDSSHIVFKRPKLRILCADDNGESDDEDELGPGTFQINEPEDIATLVKKRKSQMMAGEKENSDAVELRLPDQSNSQLQKGAKLFSVVQQGDFISARTKLAIERENTAKMLQRDTFDIDNPLDNFMEVRGIRKPPLIESSYFPSPGKIREHPSTDILNTQVEPQLPSPRSSSTLPVPVIIAPAVSFPIVVSSMLLTTHRRLIRVLENQLPNIILVERDYTRHNTLPWAPGSVSRSPILSPMADEADFTISASTGIIVTTIQKIKQKSLPGHKSKSEIRQRVQAVSLRYERLVVFVNVDSEDDNTNISNVTALAITDFAGFCGSLETSAVMYFIPGDTEMLGAWLAAVVVQYRAPDNTRLLTNETLWELFLRRAGLNCFAAQTIISALSPPDGVDMASPTKAGHFGLTAFVEMDAAERLQRFGALMGGDKVLKRVGSMLDEKWLA